MSPRCLYLPYALCGTDNGICAALWHCFRRERRTVTIGIGRQSTGQFFELIERVLPAELPPFFGSRSFGVFCWALVLHGKQFLTTVRRRIVLYPFIAGTEKNGRREFVECMF